MEQGHQKSSDRTHVALCFVPAIMLLVAILPLPYGYYTLLRIVVCISATIIAYEAYEKINRLGFWAVCFSLTALLFNPIIPIFLDRELWFFIDLVVAGLFVLYGFGQFKRKLS